MPGFILYRNEIDGATVVSEATKSGFPISNAVDGVTATKAGIVADSTDKDIIIDFGSPKTLSAFAVFGHNGGGSISAFVSVWGSADNSTYTQLGSTQTVNESGVKYHTFSAASYRYVRLRFNVTGGDFYFSDFIVTERLELERSQRHGFIKPEFADGDTITPNLTRGENLAGLTIKTAPSRAKFDLFYYSESFFSDWLELTATMKTRPIYIVYDDGEKAFYCWPYKDIPKPSTAKNINGYYNVQLNMMGFL